MSRALEALSAGEATVFVQEPLGLFGHQDADLFALKGERNAKPAEVVICNEDLQVERLFVDPGGRGHALIFDAWEHADLGAKVVALWELAGQHAPDPKVQQIVALSVGVLPHTLLPVEGEAQPCDAHWIVF